MGPRLGLLHHASGQQRAHPGHLQGLGPGSGPGPADLPDARQPRSCGHSRHPGRGGGRSVGRRPGPADGDRVRPERVVLRDRLVNFGSRSRAAPARKPPPGLPGLDPRWSRLVQVTDLDGIVRTFHVLDSWHGRADTDPAEPVGTLLCVHGNPTWSYLWRRLLADAPPGWRVVAVDQLGMGYSERIERPRVLLERIDDLDRLTGALGITGDGCGPVVTVAHDWGGAISLGWALRHRDQLRGVVLTNTAVHQPAGAKGPILIRLGYRPLLNQIACHWTSLFVRVATSLTWPRLPAEVRNAFAAPYLTRRRRLPVGEFVADIPLVAGHPSHPALNAI